MTARLIYLVIALFALAPTTLATAQTRVVGSDFRTQEVRDETLLRAGRLSIFLSLTGGWAYGSTSPDTGAGRSQNTVFSLPSIGAGYMITDAIEVRLSANGILIYSGIDGGQSQETYGVGGTLQGLYYVPIVHGMALYVGIGAGGFYSTRTEPIDPANPAITARVSGGGFQGQLPLGLLVQPGASLFLRGGIRFDFLVGKESPGAPVAGVSGGTFLNFLTNAELSLGFRF